MKAFFLFSLCFSTLLSYAQELTPEKLTWRIQDRLEYFPQKIEPESDETVYFKDQLGEKSLKIEDEHIFEGFQITAPKDLGNRDFVWYFNAPNAWGKWYILPKKGEYKPGFKNFSSGDLIYKEIDKVDDEGRYRIFQSLDNSYFEPGETYVIWFKRLEQTELDEVRGAFGFYELPKTNIETGWAIPQIEESLKLQPYSPAVQAKQLDSKGCEILLDEDFFDRDYAERRIKDIFFTIRNQSSMIQFQVQVPPCDTSPSIQKIFQKYGPPDYYLSREAASLLGLDDLTHTGIYYYDFVGFKVKNGVVINTVVQSIPYRKVLKGQGLEFLKFPIHGTIIFYKDGKQIGEIHRFAQIYEKSIHIKSPEVGIYKGINSEVTYNESGDYIYKTMYLDGKVKQEMAIQNSYLNGDAYGFYPDGSTSYHIQYKDGLLHGSFKQYDQKGNIVQEFNFEEGKRK